MSATRVWWMSFGLLVVLGGSWALATPMFASPDEPSHAIHAWAAAHGELVGEEFAPGDSPHIPFPPENLPSPWRYGLSVDAPVAYRDYGNIRCLAFDASATADCLDIPSGGATGEVLTYTGRYFVPYYLLVGLPSLVTTPGTGQLTLMRMVSVVLAAALLAAAVTVAIRASTRPLAATAVVAAITPTVLFFAASVNPSGFEIAAAVAVWSAGAALVARGEPGAERRVLDVFGLAAVALTLARPLSPAWLVVIGATLAFVGGAGFVRGLWTSSRARWWAAAIGVATALHLAWNLALDAYSSDHYAGGPSVLAASEIARASVGKGYRLLQQMVGVFGWLDAPAPAFTVVVWVVAIAALLGLAVAFASPRWSIAVGAVVVATFVLPILLEMMRARSIGYVWQGRYTLPIAVGMPILAGFAVANTSIAAAAARRLVWCLLPMFVAAQTLAFAQALRRYSVGANGTVWFFTRARWDPSVPSLLLVGVYGLAVIGLVALVLAADRRRTVTPTAEVVAAGAVV